MGTDIYIGVKVTGVTDKQRKKLPDFPLINGEGWDSTLVRDEETGSWVPSASDYACYGVGRYDNSQEIAAWARRFTLKHEGTTVSVEEEWSEGETDMELNVYRAGELVRAESKMNMMVPIDIAAMLDEGKAAIIAYHMPIGEEQTVIEGLVTALEKLVKGLS